MRWNRRARLWQRVVELESSGSDDDRNDDDRAYSRKRLPVAAGFPALARGLARNPSLRKATVSSRATVDLAKVRAARRACASDEDGATEAVVDARTFFVVEALTKQDDDDDDDFWTNPHVDLANLLLLLDAVGVAAAARPESFPRRLRVDLRGMPALCLGTAQRALIDAFPSLDVLQVGALDLDLKVTGDAASPSVEGSVKGKNLRIRRSRIRMRSERAQHPTSTPQARPSQE